jgi:hypothetical protein
LRRKIKDDSSIWDISSGSLSEVVDKYNAVKLHSEYHTMI